ncbi:MAG: hypothetical protein Q9190_006929 [Brigantiaea leucoxantha]
MHYSSRPLALIGSLAFLNGALAQYRLVDTYNSTNFFQSFNFFDQKDPTNGFVQYKDMKSAAASGLIGINNAAGGDNSQPTIYMGVDYKTKDPQGRASVRVTSQKTYTHGLFITDLVHMPGSSENQGGECGVWPAHWLLAEGVTWPTNGEIDILEGANDQISNQMTLHTTPGCSIQQQGFDGQMVTPNCDINAPGQDKNAGCAIRHAMSDSASYGAGFNAVGGGVYATEWTSQAIRIWHFPRDMISNDIKTGKPNPAGWGTPVAKFAGGCNIDQHFQNHNIIFDTTFCGDWAGDAWTSSPSCKSKAATCQAFVQENPEKFEESYWLVKSVKVYEMGGGASPVRRWKERKAC